MIQSTLFTKERVNSATDYSIRKGSHKPGTEVAGKITMAQCIEIAKQKEADMTGADLEASARTIAGTARSMGIQVEG